MQHHASPQQQQQRSATTLPSSATSLNGGRTLPDSLYVVKRDGKQQAVQFDKILTRLQKLCTDKHLPRLRVDVTNVTQKVIQQLYGGVTTTELDELAAQQCFTLSTHDPAYGELAKRIVVSNLHKNTRCTDDNASEPTFCGVIERLHACATSTGARAPLVSDELLAIARAHSEAIQAEIDYMRDYRFDYFGFKTLEKSYLLRLPDTKQVYERPQHLWMRVALGLYGDDLTHAFRCYHELSSGCYTHATPTLFNAGTPHPQLASCFLLKMSDDSIQGIFETLGQCAMISKHAGGIGLNIHNIRAKDAMIRGTNGTSNGIVPMLRVFNDTARYVDQGGGKRNGSFAIYLEPWHADIMDFLHLKRNHGDEQSRARDLFYALWVPDLFMERVHADGDWTLFDPSTAPHLDDVYGDDFVQLYEQYVKEGRGRKTMKARKLWATVLESMVETGTPYVLFKDACNRKSNQQHLGTIKSSNLCTEIVEYSSKDETAVCNLASVCLPACVTPLPSWADKRVVMHTKKGCPFCAMALARLQRLGCTSIETFVYGDDTDTNAFKEAFSEYGATFPQLVIDGVRIGGFDGLVARSRQRFDFDKLGTLVQSLVRNLNRTIDRTFYPTPETMRSNVRHRPIGLGVQGLADVFYTLRYPFDSAEAKALNEQIFATMYYNAMRASVALARERVTDVEAVRAHFHHHHLANVLEERDDWWNVHDALAECKHDAEGVARTLLAKLCTVRHPDAVAQEKHPFRTTSKTTAEHAGTYSSYEGSPLSEGRFQFDLWDDVGGHPMHDWEELRTNVQRWGARNSLLLAPMPTASTAQIMGNTECFEIPTSNIYNRRTLAGEFVVVNKFLIHDLIDAGLWTTDLKDNIIYHGGSVQGITSIPKPLRLLYKTVWDTSQKVVIDMAADRGRYICQSQSMNLFLAQPSASQISSMLHYAWTKGLKTGMYYLRTQPASRAQQFTIDPTKYGGSGAAGGGRALAVVEEEEGCLACSA